MRTEQQTSPSYPIKSAKLVKRHRYDSEFLPAALEILETPASPIRVAILWFICTLTTSTLLWTWFGTFDIVATAQGKVQPTGRVKIVQSLETGKTKSVPVADGMSVHAGDVLVELDDTEIRAEENAIINNLHAFEAEVARREAVLSMITEWQKQDIWAGDHPISTSLINFQSDIPDSVKLREQKIYQADLSQLVSSLNHLNAQRLQRQAEINSLSNAVSAQIILIETLTERVAMRTRLFQSGSASRAQVIDALQQEQEAEITLASFSGKFNAANAALNATMTEAAKLIDGVIAENATRQSETSRHVDELQQQVIKIKKRRRLMRITSPIDGTVQQSLINTVGQVITIGTELMRIVPEDTPLEIEAYLPNRDIGFVAAGQSAVIKVEAYPFTRFGLLEAKVARVATDAIPEPDAQQVETEAAKQLRATIPTGNMQRMQNLVFPATVTPNKTTISVNGRDMPLSAGMAVTVEIKTGKRRILEYLFSPLVEITSEAMREF